MSLIRARQRRKSNWMDTRKGMPQKRLLAYLFLVILVIWYLGWAF